jgi:two-component system sensor histidine kinase ChvG
MTVLRDDVVKPMSDRLAARRGEPSGKRRNFPSLRQRIVFFNAIAFLILIGGVLFVESNRVSLIDERLSGITEQARVVADTLAEYARNEDTRSLDIEKAEPLLRQLIEPTRLRARLYSTSGHLIADTRYLLARNVVKTTELPPLDPWSRFKGWISRMYDGVMGVRPFNKLAPYFEGGDNGRVYSEVNDALTGQTATAERVDEQNKLVLSVATPVQRFRTIYGVLMVTTEGGDIDDVLREERATLIEVFFVALAVMLLLSFYLSGTIAAPVRALAQAADRVRRGHAGRETIPTLEERHDEIGDLAQSFSSMTRALYNRIDAIESFAADVAHELKNPLTSLKSAVEMLSRADTDRAREELMAIVKNDVKRIDRLITDISDASRLDAELSREQSEPVDLGRLLETIVEVYRLTGIARGVKLALQVDLGPGAVTMGRDERLGQVVRNLIDNAVSFSTENGTVTVSARTQAGNARIVVEDDGPGIPPENLETIFNRFYTQRPPEHGFGKNSGLGLFLARQIVEGMNGHVWAENREGGRGARFILELPLSWGR